MKGGNRMGEDMNGYQPPVVEGLMVMTVVEFQLMVQNGYGKHIMLPMLTEL